MRRLDWVGVIIVKRIREDYSEWIKDKLEYYIGLGLIRAKKLD